MCVAIRQQQQEGEEEEKLQIAVIYTFENQVRENAKAVIKFCYEIGKTPSILTGVFI